MEKRLGIEGSWGRANFLLHVEALRWASEKGYRTFDFVALDREIAENLLANKLLDEKQRKTRHMFNLRRAANPMLLPRGPYSRAKPGFSHGFRQVARSRFMLNFTLNRCCVRFSAAYRSLGRKAANNQPSLWSSINHNLISRVRIARHVSPI